MQQGIKIGEVKLCGNAILAPMAGVSDIGFRYLARRYGAALSFTEMISVKALCFGNKRTFDLCLTAPNESPCAVQLFGSDPEAFYKACKLEELAKFDIVDINMGCPVRKVVSRGEGCSLMKNIPLATEIVQACAEGSGKPITVKHRSGFDSENAPEFAQAMQRAGAKAITVHGRTREQMYSGLADREVIKRVVQAVTVPVFGNGDILCAADAYSMMEQTGCAGVMIARGAVGKPEIFAEFAGQAVTADIYADVQTHIGFLTPLCDEHAITGLMKAHIMGYCRGKSGACDIRRKVGAAKTVADILEIARLLEQQVPC